MPLSAYLRASLLLFLVAVFVTGCGTVETTRTQEIATEMPPVLVTSEPATLPARTEPPVPSPTAGIASLTPTAAARPPSGWTMFSNPDFVRGVAVAGDHVWAATTGGVVQWNLNTKEPVLYTTREGIVEIQGNDVVYCSVPRERILVAHEAGVLSAYDIALEKWLRIPITFPDGSTMTGIETLFCDPDNQRLLVGSEQGVGIYDFRADRWTLIGEAQGLPPSEIQAIDVIGQTIWLAAGERSAFMIMGSTIFPFNGASGFPSGPVNDLAIAPDRSIWLGYPTGLVHYVEKRWNAFGGDTRGGLRLNSIDHVELGPDNIVWIAGRQEGICPFDPATLFCSTVYRAPDDVPITDLVVDDNGVAYAATDGAGVLVLGDENDELVFNRGQLVSNDMFDISISPDGKIWVSTALGINIIDPAQADQSWEVMSLPVEGIEIERVGHLLATPGGMWFFDKEEPQAAFWDGTQWLWLDGADGLAGPVLDSAVDQRGYVWFATADALFVWDGTILRPQRLGTRDISTVYHSLFEQDGTVWVGSSQGLLRYESFQWEVELPGVAVFTIAASPASGDLLLGTDHGLIRIADDQGYQWVINLGDEVVIDPVVTSIAYDGNGDLWVGTDGSGLFHYANRSWERLDTFAGMPTEHIQTMVTDSFGAVWIVASTGEGGGGLLRYVP